MCSIFFKIFSKSGGGGGSTPPNFSTQNLGGGLRPAQPPYFGAPGDCN